MSVTDVLEKHRVQGGIRERVDGLRHTSTSRLNGNVVVLLKVYAGVLLGWIIRLAEEFLLHAIVAAAGDVLTVLPDPEAEGLTGTTVIAAASTSAAPAAPTVGLRTVTTVSAAAAPVAAEAPTTNTSITTTISTVATTDGGGGGGGGAGVVPAVPIKKQSA